MWRLIYGSKEILQDNFFDFSNSPNTPKTSLNFVVQNQQHQMQICCNKNRIRMVVFTYLESFETSK